MHSCTCPASCSGSTTVPVTNEPKEFPQFGHGIHIYIYHENIDNFIQSIVILLIYIKYAECPVNRADQRPGHRFTIFTIVTKVKED